MLYIYSISAALILSFQLEDLKAKQTSMAVNRH